MNFETETLMNLRHCHLCVYDIDYWTHR